MPTPNTKRRRPKGCVKIRREKRATGEFWGYDVWIRQKDGTRKRYRDFKFYTEAEAQEALAALKAAGGRTRYAVFPSTITPDTSVGKTPSAYLERSRVNR